MKCSLCMESIFCDVKDFCDTKLFLQVTQLQFLQWKKCAVEKNYRSGNYSLLFV